MTAEAHWAGLTTTSTATAAAAAAATTTTTTATTSLKCPNRAGRVDICVDIRYRFAQCVLIQ